LKILFLTHRLPYAPNRGDRVRAYFLLKTLSRTAEIDVVSLVHDAEEETHAGDLIGIGVACRVQTARVSRGRALLRSLAALPTRVPLTHTMLDSPALAGQVATAVRDGRPDVVLAYCSGMARLALQPPLDRLPFVLDMVDVDSAKWDALARVTRAPLSLVYRREARVLRGFEATAATSAFVNLVVTDRERETLQDISPSSRVEVLPNGVDVDNLVPEGPPSETANVVFCGVMNYPPNEQAALLLAREVWPLVRGRRPDATLTLVGSHPSRTVMALADASAGITVTGAVPDVRPYLWGAAVAAAPILTARGIQNKVLEAVAAGLPTVVTPNILASLPAGVRRACVAASDAPALADAILRLLARPPAERRALAQEADIRGLAWDQQLAPAGEWLRAAAASRR
jgi:sugar transferase (PEP-CTERM/EpsH1 system associated)